MDCDGGYVCLGGSSIASPIDGVAGYLCPVGAFCPIGSTIEMECPVNTFNPDQGQAECTPCPAGYECASTGLISPDYCRASHYCPEGLGAIPCPAGTFSSVTGLQSAAQCTSCPAGKFCGAIGLLGPSGSCEAGFLCLGGAVNSTHVSCPQGYFCTAGTTSPSPCPSGTFGSRAGLASSSECTPCLAGKFCVGAGLTEPSGDCMAGYFCSNGSTVPAPQNSAQGGGKCAAGFYCPAGSISSTEVPCPNGTYGPIDGAASISDCLSCPARMYCEAEGLSSPTGLCSSGFYCVSGASTPTPQDGTSGDLCPSGHYCLMGTSVPYPCPIGTLRAAVGGKNASECESCPSGFQCVEEGLDSPSSECPSGHFCPTGTIDQPQPCPAGSYRNETQGRTEADCLICPLGYFCPSATIIPNSCPQAFHCPVGSQVPISCPQGFYCVGTPDFQ